MLDRKQMVPESLVRSRLVGAGATAGVLWMLVALFLDKNVLDFNYPVIPTNTVAATTASALAGSLTGVVTALVFRRGILTRSVAVFYGLPIVTLPFGIALFGVGVWLSWLLAGERGGVTPSYQLGTILSFFLAYGLISLLTPFLYVLALATQLGIKALLVRGEIDEKELEEHDPWKRTDGRSRS